MSFAHDFQNEFKQHSQRGRCLHYFDNISCNEIISAHSIQKSGQLSLIAEKGHVYQLSTDMSTLKKHNGLPRMKKVGLNQVSTFAGFCKSHDNTLFEPIDNFQFNSNKRQIALYAYRCLCREFFVKENAVAVLSNTIGHKNLDSEQRQSLADALKGNNLGLASLKQHKSLFDAALSTGDYDQFEFVYYTSSSPCPVQLSGVLYPDYDFEGTHLQEVGSHDERLDLITFFTAPVMNGWAFGFGWHTSSNRTCVPLLQSLERRATAGEKIADALLRFSFSCCENHAVRISWWDGLADSERNAIIQRAYMMMHPQISVPNYYLLMGCEGIADWQYEDVYSTLPKSD